MAPASPSAVLAIPDRSVVERPEAKVSDGSDGQFASLMAQFVQAPAPAASPAVQPPPGNPEKEPKAPIAESQPATAANPPSADAPAPKAEASQSKVETSNPKIAASSPKEATRDPKAVAADPQVEAPGLKTGAVMPKVEMAGLVAGTPSPVADPQTPKPDGSHPGVSAVSGEAAESGMSPAVATIATRSMPASAPIAGNAAAAEPAEARPELRPQAEGVTPPIKNTPLPDTHSVKPGTLPEAQINIQAPVPEPKTQPTPQASAMTPEQADPAKISSATVTQAVLAESTPRLKVASKLEDQAAPAEGSKSEPTRSAEKVSKSVNVQSSVEPPRTPAKTASVPAPLAIEHESAPSTGGVKPAAQPATSPEVGDSSALEAALAKASTSLQPAIASAPDGSSLAAMNATPRAVETPATAAPAAPPPAPATPPSAPVVQVEGGLRWMLKGGVQEAQLQLHPDSLGQVTIHLKVEGGEVHARLWIAEPTSVQAVQEGRPHLELCLKEQGLQLGSFDLQQGRRPFQEAPSASPFRESSIPEAAAARQEAPSVPAPSILNPHRVELYA